MSRWTEAQTQRAFKLRESGMQYKDIGAVLGKTKQCVFHHMQRHLDRTGGASKLKGGPSAGQHEPDRADPAALQAREERRKQMPRDLTALLMGDPIPLQSALHRKQSGNAAQKETAATHSLRHLVDDV